MRRYHNKVQPTVASYFPSLSNDSHIDINLNVHMFTQDIFSAIMPIGGHSTGQNAFSVSVNGDEGECEKARRLIRGMQNEFDPNVRHDDLTEMVCDAIKNIVMHLCADGCSVHEIIFDEDSVAHLYSFTSRRLLRLPGYFLQLIPKEDWDLWKKKFVLVPSKRIWYFEMPLVLGGRKGYKATIKNLGRFEVLFPNFDFQKYTRINDIYCGQVTKTWGWNRRDLSQERSTEFFFFYRSITFHWAKSCQYLTKTGNGA